MNVTTAGNGTFITSTLPVSGSTTITVTNLQSGSGIGCISTIASNNSSLITVNQPSIAPTSANASNTTICNGVNTVLTQIGGTLGTGASWKWYSDPAFTTLVGTGLGATGGLAVSPTTTTTYYVRAEGTSSPCSSNTSAASVTVTVNQKSLDPTSASASQGTICNGGSTVLTLNGGGGGANEMIKWYSGICGGAAIGSGNNLSVSPTTTTTYFGRYENGVPCNFTTNCASVTITVNARPTSTINGSSTICSGSNATLNVILTGSQPWSLTYTDGTTPVSVSGITSSPYTITVSPSTTKTYTISSLSDATCTANAIDRNGSATVTVNNITAGVITKGAVQPGPGCGTLDPGITALTTAVTGGGAITYAWQQSTDGGLNYTTIPGATADQYNPPALTTTTSIKRIATSTLNGVSCSAESNVLTYIVNPLPTVNAITPGGTTNVCIGATLQLSNSTSGGVWSSSNQSLATVDQTGLVAGVATGSPTISYTVTDGNGCSKTVNKTVNVFASPTATISSSGPTTFCIGGSVTLTASAGSSYLWSNGATTQAITVNQRGSYTVTVTNANGCSATSPATNVLVNSTSGVPAIATPICDGATSVTGSSTEAEGTVIELFINGTTAGTTTVSSNGAWTKTGLLLQANDKITAKATASNKCESPLTNEIIVKERPTLIVTPTVLACTPNKADLTSPSITAGSILPAGTTLTYYLGGGNLEPVLTPNSVGAGTYFIKAVTGDGCETMSGLITVIVNPAISNNIVSSEQAIQSGQTPGALTGTLPTGGDNSYTYVWESSTTNPTTGFVSAAGTNNTENYSPGSLTAKTWYRRLVMSGGCSNTSDAVRIDVNNNPTLTAIGNKTGNEYTAITFDANATDSDEVDGVSNTLTYSLVGAPTGAQIDGATGVFTWTPSETQDGGHTFTVKVVDGVGGSTSESITITVNEVNVKPVLADVPATASRDEEVEYSFDASATDADNTNQTLTFSLGTTAPAGASIHASTGVFTWTPTEAQGAGTYTFDVIVSDGIATDTKSITITVNEVNDEPSGADKTVAIAEDNVYTFSATDFGFSDPNDIPVNSLVAIKITTLPTAGTLKNNGVALVASGSIVPMADVNLGKFKFYPEVNANGTAYSSFTFQVKDGGGTTNGGMDIDQTPNTFTVNVTPVNDAPSFVIGSNQEVLEDASAQNIANWATGLTKGPENEAAQSLSFVITGNTNVALFSTAPAVSSDGTLTYTPAPNAYGTATISVKIKDDGGVANGGVDESAVQIFTINIKPVNDAPSFTKGANQTVQEDAPVQSVSGWATAISAGPSNESGQSVQFIVTNDKNNLFSSQPAIAPNGTLSYTVALNQHGSATINVKVKDNGGILDGGIDESAVQTFTITVTPVNDAPTATISSASQSKQYSDKITPVTVSAIDVDNTYDQLTATTQWKKDGGQFLNGLPPGLSLEVTGSTPLPKVWSLLGQILEGPGVYTINVKVNDGTSDAGANSVTKTTEITVTKEDAKAEYTGVMFARTSSINSGTVTVNLRASIYDISAPKFDNELPSETSKSDPDAGNISNAWARFKIVDQTTVGAAPVYSPWQKVSLFDANTSVGGITYDWSANIGSADSRTYDVSVEVGCDGVGLTNSYYTRCGVSDALLTISKPLNDFITGGGFVIPRNNYSTTTPGAFGTFRPDLNKKINVGLNVKYTKSNKNIQGAVHIFFRKMELRSGVLVERVYRVKTNALSSLAVNNPTSTTGKATFVAKANMQDVTDPNYPVSVGGGNMTLNMTITDNGEPGTNDQIAMTLWDGNTVVLSHLWNGSKTLEQNIGGGNLVVSGGSVSSPAARINTNATTTIQQVDQTAPATIVFDLKASPNPTTSYFILKVESDKINEAINLRIVDLSGKAIEIKKGLVNGQTLQVGQEYRPGVYLAELIQGNRRRVVRLMKLPD